MSQIGYSKGIRGIAKDDKTPGDAATGDKAAKDKAEKEKAEKDAKEKADREAREKAEREKAAIEAATVAGQVRGLLQKGGFARRLTWAERVKLRRIERASDKVRARLEDAFGKEGQNAFIENALDSLAHIEVAARLELLRKRTVKPESKP